MKGGWTQGGRLKKWINVKVALHLLCPVLSVVSLKLTKGVRSLTLLKADRISHACSPADDEIVLHPDVSRVIILHVNVISIAHFTHGHKKNNSLYTWM